jgi:ethanolamine-phosphate cytidylyltransferase
LEKYRNITMSDKKLDDAAPPGEPAIEILDGRIWIDGCFDFFHQ